PLGQVLRARLAEHRPDQPEELRDQALVVERNEARAPGLVGLAYELAFRRRHRDARRPEPRIELIDLCGRRYRQLVGERGECRVLPRLLVEVLELDAAIARREPDQIREAQLRAGEVV